MPCAKKTIQGPATSGSKTPPPSSQPGEIIPGVSNTVLLAAGAGVVGVVALSQRGKKNG